MGRPRKYREGKEQVALYLEPNELEIFDSIAWREHKGRAELAHVAILEWIKAHKEGNTTYSLDDFGKHHDLIAIPALMANRESLSKYVQEEYDYAELQKVLEQTEFLTGIIRTKMLNTKDDSEESKRIAALRSDRFRKQNDIRYKDPKTMTFNQQIRYNQIMQAQKEAQEVKDKEKAKDDRETS